MSKPSRDDWIGFATIVVIAVAMVACTCLYAQWMYDDWRCGMPGVHCRRIVKP